VGVALRAGELDPVDRVGEADDREVLGEDDEDDVADDDEDDDPESLCSSSPVRVGSAGELSAVGVAGAVVVGEDGVVGVVALDEEALVSSPSVVPPVEVVWLTSAETGFCPISSIPVTMPIASTKTAPA